MAKFMLTYIGEATNMEDMSEEKQEEINNAWQKWMADVGDAIVDIGSPMGDGASVVDDGSDGEALKITGYSIVQADSMDAAKELVNEHPFLSEGKGNFSVDIYELIPLQM